MTDPAPGSFNEQLLAQMRAVTPDTVARPTFVTAADVEIRPTYWLWEHFLPLEHLTIVAGVGGHGKGVLLATLGAHATRGALVGDRYGVPGDVVYICAEDTHSELAGRFAAAGADMERVHFLARPAEFGVAAAGALAAEIAGQGWDLAMLVLDPLDAHLWDVDTHRKSEVQQALGAFKEAITGPHPHCAVIGVAHLNKGEARAAVNRIMGSIGFSTAARSALIVAAHPENEDHRLLMLAKSNLVETGLSRVPALRYAIEGVPVGARPDGVPITKPRAAFMGWETGHDPNDLVATPSPEERTAIDEAVAFLEEVLATGPVLGTEVEQLAKQRSISARTLRRARKQLGVVTRPRGFRGSWFWNLGDATLGRTHEVGQLCE